MQKLAKANFSVNRSLVKTVRYSKQPQLYLHQFSKNQTTISFSSNPELLSIGSIKTDKTTELSRLSVNPASFQANKDFMPVLHSVFAEKVYGDVAYQMDALNYPGSFMAIGDYKVILDYMNQRPDLSNTLGFVHVNFDGVMNEGSYESNEMYTLCNIDGVIVLSEYMLDNLQKIL